MAQPPPPMQWIDVAVDELATRFSVPPSEVQRLLWEQIRTLERRARIKEFVAVLAIRQVKEVLRKQPNHEDAVTQVS